MTGIVCIWPFTIATIPGGWVLCDGTHGTIDMRGYVAIGARAGFDSGAVLGADSHDHTFVFDTGIQNANHTHDYYSETGSPITNSSDYTPIGGIYAEYGYHTHELMGPTSSNIGNHTHSIDDVTSSVSSKQLSKEILFIMKT